MIENDFGGRRAPYAPISALEGFFGRIRDRSVPERVDHRFLQRLNVASNNEYALLSALKFLGILDDRGRPTHAYRLLQSSEKFEDTLRHLVVTAYEPVFRRGVDRWPLDDLVNFFRVSSSPSQAKNAARFFLAVCRLSGIESEKSELVLPEAGQAETISAEGRSVDGNVVDLAETKARLLEKLPAPRADWSAAEYESLCRVFLEVLRNLDG